jgi:hypothetical protein
MTRLPIPDPLAPPQELRDPSTLKNYNGPPSHPPKNVDDDSGGSDHNHAPKKYLGFLPPQALVVHADTGED